jgi:metallophosphoesterase superfamily enzyme
MHVHEDWLLTAERVAVHEPSHTAVVADLHLGYAEARRRRGEAVPEDSVYVELEPLQHVLLAHRIKRLVIAGDLLEDAACRETLDSFEEWLRASHLSEIELVPGNHDAGLEVGLAEHSSFTLHPEGVEVAGWRIVHGEGRLPDGPIVHGHEHPWLRWSPKNRAIRPRYTHGRIACGTLDGPCYLSGPERLILPAYSQEAAGANVLSKRAWRPFRCHAIAENRVLDLGEVATLNRRLSAIGAFQSADSR